MERHLRAWWRSDRGWIVNGRGGCQSRKVVEHAVAKVLGTVQRTMRKHAMVEAGSRVLVAVSGGPDSVGLLAILQQLRGRLSIETVAAHVNHALRGCDSDADERCAAAAADRLGVEFVRADLSGRLADGGNLEARARELRYRCLRDLARTTNCVRIATGHTQADQAETVLSRIVRGGGASALGGIRPRRADGVIRPLIDCRREEIGDVVRRLGLEARVDGSNLDPRFQRTHIRHRVLPLLAELNPSIDRTLANIAALMRAQQGVVSDWTVSALRSVAPCGELSRTALMAIRGELRGQVVYQWLLAEGVPKRRLSSSHVDAVLGLAGGEGGGGVVDLPHGRRVQRRASGLVVSTTMDPPPSGSMPLSAGGEICWPGGWLLASREVDAPDVCGVMPRDLWIALCDFDVRAPIQVRPRRQGDRVRPLGLGGSRKLSDLFIDKKVPRGDRSGYPVVEIDGQIVWVPGVVRDESRRLTGATGRVLVLSAERSK